MIMQALRTKTRAIMIVVVIVFVVSIFAMYITRGAGPPVRTARKAISGGEHRR